MRRNPLRAASGLVAFFVLFIQTFAYAEDLPAGYQPVSGSSTYKVEGKTGTLQASDAVTIGEWSKGFDIAQGNTFNALLPANGAHLSRDITQSPSEIFGSLNVPQGKFFLVNSSGVYFSPTAQVNAAGLVASTLDIKNDDFLRQNFKFFQNGSASSLVNEGKITVGAGGLAFLGGSVENKGVLLAREGNVALASGKAMTLSFDPEGLVSVLVDEKLSDVPAPRTDAVKNSGFIRAEGGNVLLTAEAQDGLFASLVNQEGIIEAGSLSNANGKITLVSNISTGVVGNSGILKAPGGSIEVLGEKAGMFAGEATVSGPKAGTINIGGNFQGNGPLRDAQYTTVGKDASLKADSSLGEGGRIIVWSDKATQVYGNLSAKGATKGGFVETSGKDYLYVDKAPEIGSGGTWLLDPRNITITNSTSGTSQSGGTFTPASDNATVSASSINSALNVGTNVIVNTNNSTGFQSGNITVASAISKTSGPDVSLTLTAANNINVNATITSTAAKLNLNLLADDDASGAGGTFVTQRIETNGGDLDSRGRTFRNSGAGEIQMNSGRLNIDAGSSIFIQTPLHSTFRVDLDAAQIEITGSLTDPFDLFINGSNVSAQGVISGLRSVSIHSNELRLGSVTTSGTQNYGPILDNLLENTNILYGNLTASDSIALTGNTILGAPVRIQSPSISFQSALILADSGYYYQFGSLTGPYSLVLDAGTSGGIGFAGSFIEDQWGDYRYTGYMTDIGSLRADSLYFRGSINAQGPIDVRSPNIGVDPGYISPHGSGGGGFTSQGGDIHLGGDLHSDGYGVAIQSNGGDITVDGDVSNSGNYYDTLNVSSGAGDVFFNGSVATGALTVTNTNNLRFGGNVITPEGQTITARTIRTNGTHEVGGFGPHRDFTMTGDILVESNTIFRQTTGNIQIDGTINTATGNESLAMIASQYHGSGEEFYPDGNVTLNGSAGVTTKLNDISISAERAISINRNIHASTITMNSPVNTGANTFALAGDEINLLGAVSGTGNLTLRPLFLNRGMNIGGTVDSATALDLTQSDLSQLSNGFNSLTLGNSGGFGYVNIVMPVTFNDPVSLLSSAGGAINVNGQITGADNASVLLNGVATNLNANILTNGNAVTINDNVRLQRDLSIQTTGGGRPGANIAINGTVNGLTSGQEDLSLLAGTGNINLTGQVGYNPATAVGTRVGRLSLQGTSITANSLVTASSIVQSPASGTTTLSSLNTNGALGIDLNGNLFTLNGPITTSGGGPLSITNSGLLTIGSAADMTLDGSFLQDGAGPVRLAGDIRTTNDNLTFLGPITLTGDLFLGTGTGIGNILFNRSLYGTTAGQEDLTLQAGTGNITYNGIGAGVGPSLGRLVIQSAFNVTANNGLSASSLLQTAGTGTTTLSGSLLTTGGLGIDLNGTNFVLNNPITTTGGGPLSITNSGTLTIGLNADMALDGAFLQDGTGPVRLAGDIRTTNDNITFQRAVTLTGDLFLGTGTGLGNILFNSTLYGTTSGQEDLTLQAGTGNITFNGQVGYNPSTGVGVRIGKLVVQSVQNLLANNIITAASITQQEGFGTSTFRNILRTNILPGISLTGNNFSLAGAIATAGQIVINYRGTVTRTGTYSPTPILRRR